MYGQYSSWANIFEYLSQLVGIIVPKMKPQAPSCPQCGSDRVWKDGVRHLNDGAIVQRWLCRDCGYRFSDPAKTSKRKNLHSFYCRVGVAGFGPASKNSAKAVEALKELEAAEKRVAGPLRRQANQI